MKVLLSLVIIAVLYYQWAWDLPADSMLHRPLRRARPHLRRLGLGHTWKLFAPRPPAGRGEMRFEIDGRDGRPYDVAFPPESYGPEWGRPTTRVHKARQSLTDAANPRLRRSVSRWLVDHHLPEGPARGADWDGPALVRCVEIKSPPPPLSDLHSPPPPRRERVLFVIDLPAR